MKETTYLREFILRLQTIVLNKLRAGKTEPDLMASTCSAEMNHEFNLIPSSLSVNMAIIKN